jgi:hypothetical protein
MKLTIIPVDKSVGKDGKFYQDLNMDSCSIPSNIHALQWLNDSGWIEYNTTIPNDPITELPAWANCCLSKWEEADAPIPPTPPTAEENKFTAMDKLQQTDWTVAPDVGDPVKANPYLSNVQDFIDYRNVIRQYAIDPVEGYIIWPNLPVENWTTV